MPILQAPLKFYKEAADGRWFRGRHRDGVCSAVLVSPEFLFRVEQDPAGVAPEHGVS